MPTLPVAPSLPETTLLASAFSTYRIGGRMAEAYQPASVEQAIATFNALKPKFEANPTLPLTLLGWGSNSLIASNGIEGITIITRKLATIEPLSPTTLRIGAGVHLAKVATAVQELGLAGAEFFIGIPGTLGGAVVMNAGAMGQETANILTQVLIYDFTTLTASWHPASQLAFAYRQSAINPHHQVVIAADCTFALGDKTLSKQRMEANMAFRKQHHPTQPNGGSVFRNPVGEGALAVGQMVDALGGKGTWRVGDAQVSPLHGNFIVNLGQATSTHVLQLMLQVKEAVAQHYGVTIYPENKFLGQATPAEVALWQALKEGDTHL
jgi:UDP-N-acetylmuramate dehydrogenase